MVFVFGECALDVDRRELRRAGVVRALEPKAFTVLVHLLMQRHRAVSKDEILATCWPGEYVTEAALTRCLKVIRRAVADDGVRQRVIKTLRGHGYRFAAAVDTLSTPLGLLPLHSHTVSQERVASAGTADAAPVPGRSAATSPALGREIPCRQCQTVNRAARQFCATCGQALWWPCVHCGFANRPSEHFCGGCGHAVAASVPLTTSARLGPPRASTPAYLATQILARQQEVVGERKAATVLVAGLDGVPALRQVSTLEDVDDLLNRGFAVLMAAVHQVEGFLSQVTPHSAIALFGVPLACEDHVLRALHAAVGMQRAFATFAMALHQTHGVWLRLRLGVHTGPVVVSAISPDAQFASTAPGATLACATGLQQLSQDGAIVVSAAVQQQAASFFRFTTLGMHTLPELAAPVGVYTCDDPGLVTSRLEGALARQHTAFQGRQQELALLQACWERVRHGQGQVVCLVGEAGIGKSRLAYECQQGLGQARRLTVQALSYGQAMPYHAVLPLLRTLLGVMDTATPIQQRQAIHTHLTAIDAILAADTPLLALLLGIPIPAEELPALTPEAQRRRLQHVCCQVLLHQAADVPLCLLVEDGHWLDPSSQALLDLLVTALARRPLLLLCTARPGFRHPWTDATYFHQVAVEPLDAVETRALLRTLLQPYDASPGLHAWLHERTGGNPFFVEELVRTLQTRGLLTVQGERYKVAPAARRTVPDSIQGIVQARLDRLPAAEKHLVQVAAVVGPEVTWPVLSTLMAGAEDSLHRGLQSLQAAEFLYQTQPVPVPTYTFKHALVQEASYGSLLPARRQALHARIVEAIEAVFPDRLAEQVEQLAHHAVRGEVWDKAATYCQQAGARAFDRAAFREAVVSFEQALQALAHLPEDGDTRRLALDLRLATLEGRGASPILAHGCLGWVFLTQGDLEHAIRMFAQGLDLCRASGSLDWSQSIGASLGYAYALQGRLAEGRALMEEAISESIRTGTPHGWQVAWLSEICGLAGRGEEAWQHARQALDLTRQQQERGDEALALHQLGAAHAYVAPPDAAQTETYYQQSLALAEELGMLPLQAHCHRGLGMLFATIGQAERARSELAMAITMCQSMDMAFWLPQAEAALAQVEGQP